MLGLLDNLRGNQKEISFQRLVQGNSLTNIVKTFQELLSLSSFQKINLKQTEFFGDILIQPQVLYFTYNLYSILIMFRETNYLC
jgi:chromatin segregation and condensation protein Rec8/ScpA/Scc1 (kleisin family)